MGPGCRGAGGGRVPARRAAVPGQWRTAVRIRVARHVARLAAERGQATIEYIALLLIVAAALALATVHIGGHESLVDTVLDAVASGIGKSLDKLGVS